MNKTQKLFGISGSKQNSRLDSTVHVISLGLLIVTALSLSTSTAIAVDNDNDNVDDALVVSFAAAGVQSFPESDAGQTETVADISFSTSGNEPTYSETSLTDGSRISAVNIQSGNTVAIGSGSGNLLLGDAVVWGGAGGEGQYAIPPNGASWTITFDTTQQYLGLWWSAGNPDNNVQLQDENGNNLLLPAFTTASITSALLDGNSCPASAPTAQQEQDNPWMEYCGNPNNFGYVNEPYAFIHMRFETGFRQITLWGTGFEFDNLTFSETMPSFGDSEEVVGDPDIDSNWPDVLAIDPRATGVLLPGLSLSSSNDATICFIQVDENGNALNTPSIRISRTTNTNGVTAHTAETNRWGYSGTRAEIQDQIPSIRIESSNGTNPLVNSGSISLRMILTNGTTMGSCDSPQVNQIVEIRSIGITGRKEIGVN